MWPFKRSKSNILKDLETKLLNAKNRDPEKYDGDEDEDIVIDAYNAMSEIEKHGYVELIPYLYDFLKDRDEYLREKVVETFGAFRAEQIPKFKEIIYHIWTDENEKRGVKFTALGVWYCSYQGTKDPKALKILYHLLRDKNYYSSFRAKAIRGIMIILGDAEGYIHANNQSYKLREIQDPDDFDAAVDWQELESLMRKYAPDAL